MDTFSADVRRLSLVEDVAACERARLTDDNGNDIILFSNGSDMLDFHDVNEDRKFVFALIDIKTKSKVEIEAEAVLEREKIRKNKRNAAQRARRAKALAAKTLAPDDDITDAHGEAVKLKAKDLGGAVVEEDIKHQELLAIAEESPDGANVILDLGGNIQGVQKKKLAPRRVQNLHPALAKVL